MKVRGIKGKIILKTYPLEDSIYTLMNYSTYLKFHCEFLS